MYKVAIIFCLLIFSGSIQATNTSGGNFHSIEDSQGIKNGNLLLRADSSYTRGNFRDGDGLVSEKVSLAAKVAPHWTFSLSSQFPLDHSVPRNSEGVRILKPGVNQIGIGGHYYLGQIPFYRNRLNLGLKSFFQIPTAKDQSPRRKTGFPTEFEEILAVGQNYRNLKWAINIGPKVNFDKSTHLTAIYGGAISSHWMTPLWTSFEIQGNAFEGTKVGGVLKSDPIRNTFLGDVVFSGGYSRVLQEKNQYSAFIGIDILFKIPKVGSAPRVFNDDIQYQFSSIQKKANFANSEEDPQYPFEFKHRIYFEYGREGVSKEYKSLLKDLAQKLKKNPKMKLTLRGFSDGIGSEKFNQNLSRQRAKKVAEKILRFQGIPRTRMKIYGMGEKHPLSDNKTFWGRASNRRVEITIN